MDTKFLILYNEIDSKFLKCIRGLDTQISSNLQTAGIQTRPTKTNGLWCFALLPTVLFLYTQLYDVPQVYTLAMCLSMGLLFYCILFIMFMSTSCMVLTESQCGGCLPSGVVGCLLIYTYTGQDVLFAAAFTIPSTFLFMKVLRKLLLYPKTFTIGEAMVVAQCFVVSCAVIMVRCTCNFGEDNTEMDLVNITVATVLSTVGLIVTALYHLNDKYRSRGTLLLIIGAAAILELVELHVIIGMDCILRLFVFIFMERNRLQLIAFWLFLVLVSVLIIAIRTQMGMKATTITRKAFHIMAALVFGSGILLDISLMELAAGIGLGVIVLVEALRKSRIEPISSALQSAFLVYSDEKDCGVFAMTPLYLYLGLAGPIWLVPREAASFERLAGVLATGVGDTAASWFGSRYGMYKWPGGSRTLEGTAFNILSQVTTIYALILFDLLDSKNALLRTIVAATVSGLVEAKTEQVDNLILPLVTLIAFQATYFLH